MIRKCLICGKDFYTKPCLIGIGWGKYCSRFCYGKSRLGHPAWNKGLSIRINTGRTHFKKGHIPWSKGKKLPQFSGKNASNWKGGKTERESPRKTERYKKWRKSIFEYDNYTCWVCEERGGKLHPHHLLRFAIYPRLRFKKSNGLTLCEFCHKTYTNFWN